MYKPTLILLGLSVIQLVCMLWSDPNWLPNTVTILVCSLLTWAMFLDSLVKLAEAEKLIRKYFPQKGNQQ